MLLLPPPPSLVACWLGWERKKKKVEREKDLGNFFHSVWALVIIYFEPELESSEDFCMRARFGVSHCVEFKPADRRGKKW